MSLIPAFFFYIPCLFTSLASFWGVFVSLYICFHFFMLSLFVLFSFQGFFPHFYDIFVFLLTHNDSLFGSFLLYLFDLNICFVARWVTVLQCGAVRSCCQQAELLYSADCSCTLLCKEPLCSYY